MMLLVKSFPPGRGNLKVPTTSVADAIAGLALYSASRRNALFAQTAASLLVRVLGTRALPGRAEAWSPPVDGDVADELRDRLEDAVGPCDAVAGYVPRQTERGGFCMLLRRNGRSIGFVKVRPDGEDGSLATEHGALARVAQVRASAFRSPAPIALGSIGRWHYLVSEALPPVLHRPPSAPPIAAVTAQIAAALEDMTRPAEIPAHWVPMHGDLAPWNLRAVAGTLYLIDWEDVAWGPPQADAVYYHATDAAVRGRKPPRVDAAEAVRFWRARIEARSVAAAGEGRLQRDVLGALRDMTARAAAVAAPPSPAASR
jgi:hypothetical protein